ncbi:MAG: hypothetical protein ACK5PF_06185 [bacterium]|jgi:hypothetical protein
MQCLARILAGQEDGADTSTQPVASFLWRLYGAVDIYEKFATEVMHDVRGGVSPMLLDALKAYMDGLAGQGWLSGAQVLQQIDESWKDIPR